MVMERLEGQKGLKIASPNLKPNYKEQYNKIKLKKQTNRTTTVQDKGQCSKQILLIVTKLAFTSIDFENA